MKKIFFVISLVTACHLSAQSFATENINDYNNKTYKYSVGIGYVELTLKPNKTYSAKYESEGMYWYNGGTYEQRKDILQLFPDVCKETIDSELRMDCDKSLGKAHIELIFDNTSLYYTQFIKVTSEVNKELLYSGEENNSFTLGVPGMEVKEGQSRKVDGRDVITMGSKVGVTTSDVKIRKSPDTKGEVLAYYPEMFGDPLKAVPINTPVVVIARTESKVKVQNWENYWYLVQVGFHSQVWMYGEFVKF